MVCVIFNLYFFWLCCIFEEALFLGEYSNVVMICKMAKIQELNISWIPWFVDMHMDELSPNMASDLPTLCMY